MGREIRVEVEVDGTPEQAWEAIATGRGISAWFVPTEVEEREGGTTRVDFGGGLDDAGRVRVWDPPRRVVFDSSVGAMAFEWLVEARAGGTCVVRLVQSGFAAGEGFDAEYEATRAGWEGYLGVLRLYLRHFAGQAGVAVAARAPLPGDREQGWAALAGALGLGATPVGGHAETTAVGAPRLAGEVLRSGPTGVALRLDAPTPGLAFVEAVPSPDGSTMARFDVYLYGDGAAGVAAREAPGWRAWLGQRFPQ